LPDDLLTAVGILIVFSLLLEEIGRRLPIIRSLGGKVLLVTFLPAYLVYRHWIPKQSIKIIDDFMKNTDFLTLFIVLIVVGSLLSMSRTVLIKSTAKIFLALISAQIVGILSGIAAALTVGFDVKEALIFVIIPVMAGGVGEGILPLSMGYAALFGASQGMYFARMLPCVFMGGLIGVLYAGILNRYGLKHPELTGNGVLVREGAKQQLTTLEKKSATLDETLIAFVVAVILYFVSVLCHDLVQLPVPIVVLLVVLIVKVLGIIPSTIASGSQGLYNFTVRAIAPLLLFGVGVAMTPWEQLIAVFKDWRIILILFVVVTAIVITGYVVGKLSGLYGIDSAIVISCCSGQGGTGALAILAAGERMTLMPFAQVSVRIGGALVVTIALKVLRLIG
jgi:Na+/citrate or Na+/malate symporter